MNYVYENDGIHESADDNESGMFVFVIHVIRYE